jgi:hypothetical protein
MAVGASDQSIRQRAVACTKLFSKSSPLDPIMKSPKKSFLQNPAKAPAGIPRAVNKIQKAILFAVLLAIPAAHASLYTYNWSETGSSYGNAHGTLTISDVGSQADSSASDFNFTGQDYGLTAFTGTGTSGGLSGKTIALPSPPDPPGTEVSEGLDVLNFNDTSRSSLQGAVISFSAGGNYGWEIVDNDGGSLYFMNDGSYNDSGHDSFTVTAVPEPGTWMSGALLVGVAGFTTCRSLWRKRRLSHAEFQ